MPRVEILDFEDPRLEPFREMRNRNWTESSGIFIAEGMPLVSALLASDYQCQCVLLDRKYQDQFDRRLPPEIDVLVVDHDLAQRLVGYQFHRGVIGCGRRKTLLTLPGDLDQLLAGETLVALVGIQDPENVGCILRTAAALGVHRVVVGPGCADPFSKRALRVSMGASLTLEIFRSMEVEGDIHWLRREHQVACLAASPNSSDGHSLECSQVARSIEPTRPTMILFGNEAAGLPDEILKQCEFRTHVEMSNGVDSLNVCVAAGIILHRISDK